MVELKFETQYQFVKEINLIEKYPLQNHVKKIKITPLAIAITLL
jgi:hypothetical protein